MKRRNMTAMAMAAMMIMANVSPSMVALAAKTGGADGGDTAPAKQDVTESGNYDDVENVSVKGTVADQKNVTANSISGDVTAEYATVTSDGKIGGDVSVENSSVIADSIGGKVTAKKSSVTSNEDIGGGVQASKFSEIWSYGSISGDVKAGGDSSVTSCGDVKGMIGAEASGVTVMGNVDDSDSEKEEEDYTIGATGYNEYEAKVDVLGDLISKDGQAIRIYGDNASVIVQGDVKAKDGNEISIDVSYAAEGSEVAIGNTLKNGENGATLVVGDTGELPEIVVGTIEDIAKLNVKTSDGKTLEGAAKQEVISSIKYIIDRNDLENGMLTITTVDGKAWEQTDSSEIYRVAKAGETFKVKINAASGYELSAGKAQVVRNADGTYTVTVPEGGGVDLNAVLKAITTTVTRSSGGGSSSTSGLHAIAVTPGMGRTNNATTPGSWKKNADSTWNYVNADGGIYKSTWIVSDNRWYYADANGRIATGWMEINGVWYYFSVADTSTNPEGSMLAGTTTPDGYKLASNGAWVK